MYNNVIYKKYKNIQRKNGATREEPNPLIRQPTKQNRIKQHIYLTIIVRGRAGYEIIYIYIYIYIYLTEF